MNPNIDGSARTPMSITIAGHLFASLPFFDVEDTDEQVIVDLHNRDDLVNVRGGLQGGLVATLIDVAGGRLAVRAAGGTGVSTADMSVHFLSAVVAGPARAVATLVRRGSRSIVVAVDVFDVGADRLAARATLSFAILNPGANSPQPTTAP